MYVFLTSIKFSLLSFDIFIINTLRSVYNITDSSSVFFVRRLNKLLFFSINVKGVRLLNCCLKYFTTSKLAGLILKHSMVRSLYSGFYFVNWFIAKTSNNKICSSVNSSVISNYKFKLKVSIKGCYNSSFLVKQLNEQICVWIKEFKNVGFFNDLSLSLDFYTYKLLWKWCRRFHPRRPSSWIFNKYWKNISGKYKFFSTNRLTGETLFLLSHNIILVSSTFLFPYCTSVFELFDRSKFHYDLFKKVRPEFPGVYGVLFDIQKGICPFCNKIFLDFNLAYLRILCLPSFFCSQRRGPCLMLVHRSCYSIV